MFRILLTGGAGYVGSHTAKSLAKAGFEPVTLDNLTAGHRWAVKWGPFIKGDIADQALVREVVADYRIQAVLHFAAHASVEESMRSPRKYFRNNVTGSMKLFEALLDSSVKHVVFSSTCATYGLSRTVPIRESHPQNPVNPYGDSKLMIERALKWHAAAYALSYVSLRYFNAAGADPEGEIGEAHDPETHLIPRAIGAASGALDALRIYGADYPTSDGTAIRDYTHVTDLAEAHVLALRYLLDGGASGAFNLGTGRGHSVCEAIRAVEEISERPVPVRFGPRRPGDPAVLVAEASKARRVLGWTPRHSELHEIVRTAWEWHCAYGDRPDVHATAVG